MLKPVSMKLIDHPLNSAPIEDCTEIDFTDPLVCSKQDLVALYNTVKDTQVRAFLVGILDAREYFALAAPGPRLSF